ncbi:hypothetical protein GCM10009639_54300 [Kitasatospora putterlickiae]|uniref:Uncharacterized protein n=1 Tax=Kitasatospora putterlickiae TaxID=221725 RepID=A0ABN1YDV1_9ACTN
MVPGGAEDAEERAMGGGSRLFDMRCELSNIRGCGCACQECPVGDQHADPIVTFRARPLTFRRPGGSGPDKEGGRGFVRIADGVRGDRRVGSE